MHLDFIRSHRAATPIRAYQKLAGLTDEEFSDRTGGAIPGSSINHFLRRHRGFTMARVMSLGRIVASDLPCSFPHLIQYIESGRGCPRLVRELVSGTVFPLNEQGLDELVSTVTAAEAGAKLCQMFRRFPTPALLTDRLLPTFYRSVSDSLGPDADNRFQLIRSVADRRQSQFAFGMGKEPLRTEIFMSSRNLEHLLCDFLPAIGATRDDLNELVENWITAARHRPVYWGIYQSNRLTVGRVVDRYFRWHDSVTVLDRHLSVRRIQAKPGTLWLDGRNSDAESIIRYDSAAFRLARHAVPYDLDDKDAAERVLRVFLSRRTWLDRANTAAKHRRPNLN